MFTDVTLERNQCSEVRQPTHTGKVWRGWVDIHWAGYGTRPAKIWGFVDLSVLPDDNDIRSADNNDGILPGIYAIVESAYTVDDEDYPYRESEI